MTTCRRRRRTARTARTRTEVDPSLGPAIVAVVAGEGLERVFRDLGVAHILRGGQTANPSTGELLRIARLARSREVILLPNNPNVRLAAEQAARICEDRRLVVVPTRNAAEGVAALLAFDADARRGRERRADDRGRPRPRDGPGHRGRPRREDRRREGQEGPDDRPRPGRRPRRGGQGSRSRRS